MPRKIKNAKTKAIIKVLEDIEEDTKNNVLKLTGKSFDAETAAKMLISQAAAISAMASILQDHLKYPPKRGY